MTTTIVLTPEIRSLPYFSFFTEESVDVPAKPFLLELLSNTLVPKPLSLEEIFSCIETCIYFTLDTFQLIRELAWKIGVDKKTFHRYGKPQGDEVWIFGGKLPVLVKAELDRTLGIGLTKGQLVSLGIRCLKATSAEIAEQGNLKLLKWAYTKAKFPKTFWMSDTCDRAANHGHLDCLKYAHEKGCKWDEFTLIAAAGNLPCLRYCHENKCPQADPFIQNICTVAAEKGSLECLQYLHEQGYPWGNHLRTYDNNVCKVARKKGHLDCLAYALKHGLLE